MPDSQRRSFLKLAGISAAALWLGRCGPAGPRRPNFIVIMGDDLSAREFGCYGHPTHRTPHVDRLAAAGVMFKTCWCTPICLPSRAAIMTGRYGFRTGWFHNQMRPQNEPLPVKHTTFAEFLERAGYATAVAGKWQLPGDSKQHGFDEYCLWATPAWEGFGGPVEGPELRGRRGALPGRSARYWHPSIVTNDQPVKTTPSDYGPDIFAEFVVDFFRRHADRPVFVYYPMVLPHRSWDFENDTDAWLPVPEVDAQGRRTGHRVPGSLQSNVEYIDTLVGRILRGLERLGLREDTIVFFTGDNGSSGWGKASVEQERGPRVPMIVNGPAHVIPQGPVDALVDFTDVLPTLCELAQAQLPADHELDGRSFAPILRGEISDTREWIFSYYADYRMLRDKRWLLAGDGRFFDCGDRRDEEGYVDVTDSDDPAVVAARRRFQKILRGLPGPTPEQQRELRFEVQGFGSPRKPNDE